MVTGSASAQETQQPSDPEADSPSGVVYELPFDRARRDAAPRRREGADRRRRAGSRERSDRDGAPGDGDSGGGQTDGDSGGGGPAPGRDPTSIRSENNFGSSSQVPGVDDGTDTDGGRAGDRGDGGSDDRASADDGEFGGAGPSPEAGAGSFASTDPASESTAGSSDVVVISLLGLILVVGAGLGVMAGRARRRSS